MQYTIVTGLININRHLWHHYFRRTWEEYLIFMSSIFKIDSPMCIYVEKDTVDFVENCRKDYKDTKIVIITLDDYILYSKVDEINDIQTNDKYIKNCKEKTCPEVSEPLYNVVVNNKVDFLYRTSVLNPFNTEYFIWLDAGYGHGLIDIPEKYCWYPEKHLQMAMENNIVVNVFCKHLHGNTLLEIFKLHQEFIDGGMIVCNKKSIKYLHSIYYDIIEEAMNQGIIDDDQFFMGISCLRNNNLFMGNYIPGWKYRKNIILNN